ncbi:MAG: 6-bladed beta-propeller [Gammaproteobacteria bacterium]
MQGAKKGGQLTTSMGTRGSIGSVLIALTLAACATEPVSTVIDLTPGSEVSGRVWPRPPEIPRYQYMGVLLGEQNVRRSDGSAAGDSGGGFWRWLTGMGESPHQPVVLQRPQSGVTDSEGRIYVTDVSRQAVFVFDVPQGKLHLWEYAEETRRFVSPVGIVIDNNGDVLVADAELKQVFRFAPDGSHRGSFGEGLLQRPTGLAMDRERGHLYVADTDAGDIKVFNQRGELLDTVGFRGTAKGRLNRPVYLAFAHDRLYVTDTLNARIQVFDREGNALQVIGQRGLFVGNLTRPKGVAVDDEGHVYVVEGFYDYLLVFGARGEFLMAMGGTGQEEGQFYLPTGVWTDQHNRVYIADMFNGRVSIFQFLGEEQ